MAIPNQHRRRRTVHGLRQPQGRFHAIVAWLAVVSPFTTISACVLKPPPAHAHPQPSGLAQALRRPSAPGRSLPVRGGHQHRRADRLATSGARQDPSAPSVSAWPSGRVAAIPPPACCTQLSATGRRARSSSARYGQYDPIPVAATPAQRQHRVRPSARRRPIYMVPGIQHAGLLLSPPSTSVPEMARFQPRPRARSWLRRLPGC